MATTSPSILLLSMHQAALADGRTARTADVLDALGVALLAQGKPKEAEEAGMTAGMVGL